MSLIIHFSAKSWKMEFESTFAFAKTLDEKDELSYFRDKFHIPMYEGKSSIYLNGNSLGLQPKTAKSTINQELQDWQEFGVEGHFKSKTPWVSYHEILTNTMAEIVGAKSIEVIIMNTLTVNLHLMMVSFYRPTKTRYKILTEYSPFPSDSYALKSQLKFHGFDPRDDLIELKPDKGEIVSLSNIKQVLDDVGEEIALILIGGVNYYTGQVYDMKQITSWGHEKGCVVGFDLAHAAGNIPLKLHDWGVDFAVWCTYKYLNSGPGSIGGCFVNEKYANSSELHRFAGWWGHDKDTRFLMDSTFIPIKGAEGWQQSNPPIFALAAIQASLMIFKQAGMDGLRKKSIRLTNYTEYLLKNKLEDKITIITPMDSSERGCQLSIVLKTGGKKIHSKLLENGVFCDWREPNVIRIAPVPLYNNYSDVFRFVSLLEKLLS